MRETEEMKELQGSPSLLRPLAVRPASPVTKKRGERMLERRNPSESHFVMQEGQESGADLLRSINGSEYQDALATAEAQERGREEAGD